MTIRTLGTLGPCDHYLPDGDHEGKTRQISSNGVTVTLCPRCYEQAMQDFWAAQRLSKVGLVPEPQITFTTQVVEEDEPDLPVPLPPEHRLVTLYPSKWVLCDCLKDCTAPSLTLYVSPEQECEVSQDVRGLPERHRDRIHIRVVPDGIPVAEPCGAIFRDPATWALIADDGSLAILGDPAR